MIIGLDDIMIMVGAVDREEYLPPKKAAELLGVHPLTLYRWAKRGKIKYIKTPGGRFRYPLSEIMRILGEREKADKKYRAVIYVRATPSEEKDISRKIERLKRYAKEKGFIIHDKVIDITSGLCSERPGLKKVLELAKNGEISTIIVEEKSDISPICYWVFEELFQVLGVKVKEVSKGKKEKEKLYHELLDFIIEVLQKGVM